MAASALKAGLVVHGFDVNAAVVERFQGDGGQPGTLAEVAPTVGAAMVVVLNAAQTESVLFGDDALVPKMAKGAVVIACATVPPEFARDMAARCEERGVLYLDAPISGGSLRAADGDLTIMAAGSDAAFAAAGPALEASGSFVGTLSADLALRFQYDGTDDSLSYQNRSGNELEIKARADVAYAASATLGPDLLSIEISEDDPPGDNPELDIGINFDLSELTASALTPAVTGGLSLDPRIDVDLPSILPDVYAKFEIDWSLNDPANPTISIPEVGIDLAALVKQLEFILEPLTQYLFEGATGAILNTLSEPIPGINDFFSELNLPDPLPAGTSFIGDGGVVDLAGALGTGGDGTFNSFDLIGAYMLGNGRDADYKRLSTFVEILAYVKALDEVAAHLDAARRAALYDEICALGAQAWMTGTGPEVFEALGERAQHLEVAEVGGAACVG